jgi:hypothetical protein
MAPLKALFQDGASEEFKKGKIKGGAADERPPRPLPTNPLFTSGASFRNREYGFSVWQRHPSQPNCAGAGRGRVLLIFRQPSGPVVGVALD